MAADDAVTTIWAPLARLEAAREQQQPSSSPPPPPPPRSPAERRMARAFLTVLAMMEDRGFPAADLPAHGRSSSVDEVLAAFCDGAAPLDPAALTFSVPSRIAAATTAEPPPGAAAAVCRVVFRGGVATCGVAFAAALVDSKLTAVDEAVIVTEAPFTPVAAARLAAAVPRVTTFTVEELLVSARACELVPPHRLVAFAWAGGNEHLRILEADPQARWIGAKDGDLVMVRRTGECAQDRPETVFRKCRATAA